jgi:transcriptional regulator with XRE-family HTH domain
MALPVGDRLKQAREAAGLSAAAAGKLIGVHENTVYALEKDAEAKTVRLVRKAAAVYGITDGQLFGEAEPRVPPEFRPLLEPLLPFDRPAREAIIRNIASNLGFMASMFAGANISLQQVEKETSVGGNPYPVEHNTTARGDAPGSIPLPPRAQGDVDVDDEGDQREGNDQRSRRHAPHPTRKGRKPS